MNIYEFAEKIDLDISSVCNTKCRFCGRTVRPNKYENKFSDINKLTKILKKFKNVKKIHICGIYGDCSLHPHLLKLVKFIKENMNCYVVLHTNGALKNDKLWIDLACILDSSNNSEDRIKFALDGLEDTHHLHRSSNFNDVFNNMMLFKKNGGKTVWQFVVFKHNEHQIPEVKTFCDSKKIKLQLKASFGYDDICQEPSFMNSSMDLENKLNITEKTDTTRSKRIKSCKSLKNKSVYIDIDNNIYPCTLVKKNNPECKFINGNENYHNNTRQCKICKNIQ